MKCNTKMDALFEIGFYLVIVGIICMAVYFCTRPRVRCYSELQDEINKQHDAGVDPIYIDTDAIYVDCDEIIHNDKK